MVKVFLEGSLGKRFGRKWELDVRSPAEALRAINMNTKGALLDFLSTKGAKKYYKVAVDKKTNILTKDEFSSGSGKGDIYIIPTIGGAGDNPWTMIVIGVLLVALTIFTFGGATPLLASFAGLSAAQMVTIGVGLGLSLAIGGIIQLLTPTPSIGESSSDQSSSNLFQGNAGAISQGSPVPLIYGRCLVSPLPISFSISTSDKSIAT